MILHRGPAGPGDEALELALAHALVRRASDGPVGEALRVYRPSSPVVVFGRRDTRLPGFPTAVEAAREAGFEPLVRATGGRAVAYTEASLVVDHVRHDTDATRHQERRFESYGRLYADVFTRFGIDARVGALPGEYCPGAHSINARGVVKLVGTSQRVVRNAWLFSSLVVVGDQERIRPVLAAVYAALGQELDPASVGSLSGEVPSLTVDEVERALLTAYGAHGATPLDEATLAVAHELVGSHRVSP
jgi:octanoyl-[GcvH]:protein N-octanoyltransferase